MKAKIYFLAMAFVALLMVGCSDDDGIQLTQDEIIGDINTGKQVGIKGNSLVIYTTQGARVNVQGAKGKISAQSSDEKVVTVTCIHETGQYGKDERISLSAIAVGKAIVTVTEMKMVMRQNLPWKSRMLRRYGRLHKYLVVIKNIVRWRVFPRKILW